MLIKQLLEYITLYHGAMEHGNRNMGHTGNNSTEFGYYNSKRYGIFLSDNPNFAKIYGDVKKYGLSLSPSEVPDVENGTLINDFISWADEKNLNHVTFFFRHQFNHVWELFEEEIGEAFLQFARENHYKAVKFTEYQEDDSGKKVKGTTYVVFDISVLKRSPNKRQGDLFFK